jgi:flagellar hook assembly protein FlgD
VTVYNLQGVVVRSLALESVGAGGSQSLSWDGRTDTGRQLPSGVYFVKLEAGATTVYRKLLLLGSQR